ncbi:hypothetical protein J5277_28775 [Rhizobium sp. 16-449-1b]|uniref:hypothetical protein n=1 Tax=Rhizobium sp. 16-449-1b TaxID=2819989 RepID=UPI001AD9A9A2|nr:hypothetical protein [Rhizobium sp. 16-449-1b]MBO9198127.1 hypothetical protein [Rhizobium sp. 16-449-1b]
MQSANRDGSEREAVDSGKLVAAFGRNGGTAASRAAAKSIVEAAHARKRWFFCECRDGATLTPVNGTHVMRKTQYSKPHHEDCPFAVEPKEQFFIVRSLRPHPPGSPFSLLRNNSSTGETEQNERVQKDTYSTRRPRLARLLVAIAEASVQRQTFPLKKLGPQFADIKDQARALLLAPKVPVIKMLCSDTSRYEKFIGDFSTQSKRHKWTAGNRPHGILLDTIKGVEDHALVCTDDTRIPVFGSISIFGRATAPVKPWSTYLVAGLIGEVSSGGVHVLRAYIHPCVSEKNLMLVDSNYERETFRYIAELAAEYREQIDIIVRKPLSDIGTRSISENLTEEEAEVQANTVGAPKILIPDFIIGFPQFPDRSRDIIVETLGFSWRAYRDDKAVTIPAMQAALGQIDVIAHDFHFPDDKTLLQRHDTFKASLRSAIEKRIGLLRH